MDFIRTIIIGVKQGANAAWYDLKWYIIIMGIILILAIGYNMIQSFLRRK